MGRYIVTGAANGIGAETAARLLARGDEVVGVDLAPPEAPAHDFIAADLGSEAGVEAALAGLEGTFDGLCNAAGLPPRDGNAGEVLAVNFLGLRALTDGLLDRLAPGGAVVNLASRAGKDWATGAAQAKRLAALRLGDDIVAFLRAEEIDATRAYRLSKEAVILWTFAMTEPLLARDLRMNCASPSAVATAILSDFQAAFGETVARNVARTGRPGAPEDIAPICIWLMGPESAWVRGADISADGGMSGFLATDAMGLEAMRRQNANRPD